MECQDAGGQVMTVINTERLRLRSMVEGDAAYLNRIYRNADAMRYWSKALFTDPLQAQEFVQAVIAADPAATIEFVIEHEGRVIGHAARLAGCRESGAMFISELRSACPFGHAE